MIKSKPTSLPILDCESQEQFYIIYQGHILLESDNGDRIAIDHKYIKTFLSTLEEVLHEGGYYE